MLNPRKYLENQCGSTTVLALALLLPLFAIILQLGIEFFSYLSVVRNVERRLDRAVVDAASYLPSAVDASAALDQSLLDLKSKLQGRVTGLTLLPSVNNGVVRVSLTGEYVPEVLKTLLKVENGIHFKARSEASRAPEKVGILLDLNSYMGPVSEAMVQDTRAGNYFMSQFGDSSYARLRTQRCVNPVLGPLKRAVLGLSSWYAQGSGFRPLIGSFPGIINQSSSTQTLRIVDEWTSLSAGYQGRLGRDSECRLQSVGAGYGTGLSVPMGFQAVDGMKQEIWNMAVHDPNDVHVSLLEAVVAALHTMAAGASENSLPSASRIFLFTSSRGIQVNADGAQDLEQKYAQVVRNLARGMGQITIFILVYADEGPSPDRLPSIASEALERWTERFTHLDEEQGILVSMTTQYVRSPAELGKYVNSLMASEGSPVLLRRTL